MDIEKNRPEIAKKLCKMGRIVLYMMRKNIAKSKMVFLKRRKMSYLLSCRSDKDIISSTSFFSPRDYEFSCSDTPLYSSSSKPNNNKKHHRHNNVDVVEIDSPGQAVEIDDSAFCQVDKDAEEFINKFYRDLMKQKRFAALESPSPLYHHLSSSIH